VNDELKAVDAEEDDDEHADIWANIEGISGTPLQEMERDSSTAKKHRPKHDEIGWTHEDHGRWYCIEGGR